MTAVEFPEYTLSQLTLGMIGLLIACALYTRTIIVPSLHAAK